MKDCKQKLTRIILETVVACIFVSFGTAIRPHVALGDVTERVSVDSAGVQGNADSRNPSISGDGRFVAFESNASNLSPGGTGIVLRDRQTGVTRFISLGIAPAISADGRFVAFYSQEEDLVPDDTNGVRDAFVYDVQTGAFTRVSVDSNGNQANDTSGGGFRDGPAISADGRFVAFISWATNLVPGDTNGFPDVFVHDRDADENGLFDEPGGIRTTRVSVPNLADQGTLGTEADCSSGEELSMNAINADGRFVAFNSCAANLVLGDTPAARKVFLHDRQTGATLRVGGGWDAWPSLSADSRFVAFGSLSDLVSDDTNGRWDIYVYDRGAGTISRVSVSSAGVQGDGDSFTPSISADGRFVSFESNATNLVDGDTNTRNDIFVHDRQERTTIRVSVATDGTEGNNVSGEFWHSPLSADGLVVAFVSQASNLVPGDTNESRDVFVRDREVESPELMGE